MLVASLVGLLLLSACGESKEPGYRPEFGERPEEGARTLIFGVHPLHNPRRLFEVYQPLVEAINPRLEDHRIKLEASRNYAAFDRKLIAGHFHFALPNPYQTVVSLDHGYRVFAKQADDADFRGIFLVRRDGPVNSVDDLRGATISYPAPTALAATMMPQWFLHEQGLDVMEETRSLYVGSQESSIMNVYLGNSAAGATWPPPWRAFARERPEIAAQLEVRWETDPLPNNSMVVREDVPAEVVETVTDVLVTLPDSEAGRSILAGMESDGFVTADNATYDPVRDFIRRFEAEVRTIRQPTEGT